MYKIICFIALATTCISDAKCHRTDYKHADENVRLCRYYQEDIYNNYAKKLHVYKDAERYKECFFCGCPIEEHSKREVVQPKK